MTIKGFTTDDSTVQTWFHQADALSREPFESETIVLQVQGETSCFVTRRGDNFSEGGNGETACVHRESVSRKSLHIK